MIQKHQASQLHYDFRLEWRGVLLSWAVPKGPSLDPSVRRLAAPVEDHPLEYGGFEGVIPDGEYGGGTVMLWDRGTWTPEDPDVDAALKNGELKFTLHGKKLRGAWVLVRTKLGYEGSKKPQWLLIKHRDRYASTEDILTEKPRSILTITLEIARDDGGESQSREGRSSRSACPFRVQPMLATLVKEPLNQPGWVYEEKYDGYRILAYKEGSRVTLLSRNAKDRTAHFHTVAEAVSALPHKRCCWMAKWWPLTAAASPVFNCSKTWPRRCTTRYLTASISMAAIFARRHYARGATALEKVLGKPAGRQPTLFCSARLTADGLKALRNRQAKRIRGRGCKRRIVSLY